MLLTTCAPAVYLSMVREPVERLVSNFYYLQSETHRDEFAKVDPAAHSLVRDVGVLDTALTLDACLDEIFAKWASR